MDASNQKHIRIAEKAAKLDEERRRNFLVGAMTIPEGRAWLHNLLESCHLFADPFTGDALLEAYSKGERNVGLRLFADITNWAPDHYITMIKEANHVRSTIAELTRSADRDGRDQGYLDSADDFNDDRDPAES